MFRVLSFLLCLMWIAFTGGQVRAEESPQAIISKAIAEEDAEVQAAQIKLLVGKATPEVLRLLKQWKDGEIYLYTDAAGIKSVVIPEGEKDSGDKQVFRALADGKMVSDADGKALPLGSSDVESADTTSSSRMAIKAVMDMAALLDTDFKKRLQAIQNIGLEQDPEKLPALKTALAVEKDSTAIRALNEAVAFVEIKSDDPAVKLAACRRLGELQSIPSQDVLKGIIVEASAAGQPELAAAAQASLDQIAIHVRNVNTAGTIFRGISTGSVLLVVAIGLVFVFLS